MNRPSESFPQALPHIEALVPYTPGQQPEGDGWIKLNTNENPYPPSPRVAEAIRAELPRLPLYPNPVSRALREAIADFHGLESQQVLIGNGSDDVLNLLFRSFCDRNAPAGMLEPGYSLYPVLADIQNAPLIKIEGNREMILDPENLSACGAAVFFLTSPNAPTGIGYSRRQIIEFLDGYEGLLVVDEAYAAFAQEDAVPLLGNYPNLVITRTFSKSYGLAGLRVGYALAAPKIIQILDRVRDSYNVNHLSQAGALTAFLDTRYYENVIEKIKNTREEFLRKLKKLNWFTYPTQANYLFTEPCRSGGRASAETARDLFEFLQDRKILVRYIGGSPLTEGFLRISVGTDKQMKMLLAAIDQWMKRAQPK